MWVGLLSIEAQRTPPPTSNERVSSLYYTARANHGSNADTVPWRALMGLIVRTDAHHQNDLYGLLAGRITGLAQNSVPFSDYIWEIH